MEQTTKNQKKWCFEINIRVCSRGLSLRAGRLMAWITTVAIVVAKSILYYVQLGPNP